MPAIARDCQISIRIPRETDAWLELRAGGGKNKAGFGTVIICPITTTERPHFKWRIAVAPRDLRLTDKEWQAQPHWVETDQIVTVDTQNRTLRHLATVVNDEILHSVDDSLRMMLIL